MTVLEIYRMSGDRTTYPPAKRTTTSLPESLRGLEEKLQFNTMTDNTATTSNKRRNLDKPDNLTGMMSYSVELNRSDTDNPAPYQEETRKPDTGFRGMRYEINAVFEPKNNSSDFGKGLALLLDWYKETSDVRGTYRNGRFGIINEYSPELSIHPTKASGMKLTKVRIEHDMQFNIKKAVIVLEQSGTSERIGKEGSTIDRSAMSS